MWTVGEMLSLPLLNAVIAERAGSSHRGRYMGVYLLSFSVAFILAPTAGTWVYDRFGPTVLWFGVGAMAPVLWVAAVALRRCFAAPRVP